MFGGELLKIAENIAWRGLKILYYLYYARKIFSFRAETVAKMVNVFLA